MSYVAIWDYWKSKIEQLKTDWLIKQVLNYDPKQVQNWPIITINPSEWQEVYFDSHSNEATFPFLIKIIHNYQEDTATAEQEIREIVDKVLEIIRNNYIFSYSWGKVHRVNSSYIRWRWDEQYIIRRCDITVTNYVLYDINS